MKIDFNNKPTLTRNENSSSNLNQLNEKVEPLKLEEKNINNDPKKIKNEDE